MALRDEVEHPAKFNGEVLQSIQDLLTYELRPNARVLDPFAGVGGVHALVGFVTTGIELEPEWADQHPLTEVGNALALRFRKGSFDAIVTSPCYGNRMADHHEARDATRRHTYKHMLGREPSSQSSAVLQWGDAYREFHEEAIVEITRVCKREALFVLNISDHIRAGRVQPVSAWWAQALTERGWMWVDALPIETPRQRHGENGDVRVDNEWVLVFRRML